MKLSSKLNRGIIILLILVILASVITSIYVFNNSLESFVNIQRERLFEQISNDLENFNKSDQGLNPAILENYAINENLLIELYSTDNELVNEYNGISEDLLIDTSDLVSIRIDLIDNQQIPLGYLNISYLEDAFEYDQSIVRFQNEILQNYTIILILSMIIGSIFVIFFSKTITDPITDLQDKTRSLRQKDYSIKEKKYNIYEIDELSSDIDFLGKSLQEQEKLRTNYAQDIAHELRTPMTNLLLHLEGIQDNIIKPEKEIITLLLSETKRLNGMIDNLETSFNNSELDTKVNLEQVNLAKLIDKVLNSFSPLLQEKNISVSKLTKPDYNIITDKNKMTQIMSNLVSNSIKAIENTGEIKVEHRILKNKDIIIVSDNGVGMKEEDLQHIFDRFYRIDNVRNTKVSGHGLGLSITKNFIDLMGYNIAVNSELGKGSEFIISIPNKKSQL